MSGQKVGPQSLERISSRPSSMISMPLTESLNYSIAYCELYLILAALFAPGRFRFELYEMDITDIETAHDFFLLRL